MRTDERGRLLCVADGCGGLGSRRYRALGAHTGAYVASRLVTRTLRNWAEERERLPATAQEGRELLGELEGDLHNVLTGFAEKNCLGEPQTRIVGSMQRLLPSTLCAALAEPTNGRVEVCYLWAGDSRGYALTPDGLCQFTSDHARGNPDAFDSLYRDVPLSNLISADQPVSLSARRVTLSTPCVLLCATDGAFNCLPTPMEFEMLLLSTMAAAMSYAGWQARLESALKKLAHDDATLLVHTFDFNDFGTMKQRFAPRLATLKREYITPVRHRRHDADFARERWQAYRKTYDQTEGAQSDGTNWRL